jgi:selenoprotein W-related protein
LAADILREFEPDIAQITLIPSEGGRFEVVVSEHVLYSKAKTGRHARQGEIMELFHQFLKERAR